MIIKEIELLNIIQKGRDTSSKKRNVKEIYELNKQAIYQSTLYVVIF